MKEDFVIGAKLGELVDKIVASYGADGRTQHIDKLYLPSRIDIVQVTKDLLELLYPGLVGRQHLTQHNVAFHVGDLLPRIGETLCKQIHNCLCYQRETLVGEADTLEACEKKAHELTLEFLEGIPDMRQLLAADVQAAFDGDPAAVEFDEVVLAYPGVLAISTHRMAHSLYRLGVPLMPRIMAEWIHNETGIDIHPGARIGERFFIDHGTGVVIGETADIGNNVKIYQGVTLGAISFPKDERGRIIRETKRHPTLGDNVT
ncbi:MAG: serine O-acetyltransferase, partial [Phycisphaerae bacterium]